MAEKTTGQWVGTIVGAVIGFVVGDYSGQMAMLGASLGGAVGGAIDPPKGPHIVGPRVNDLSAQTATYGAVIPRLYGTVAISGNVFWLEGDQVRETSSQDSQGGKGGGGGATTTTYHYSATFAVGLCEGPISGIRRMWIGDNLVYDAGSDDIESVIASNSGQAWTLYRGTDDQAPNARMQADKGIANVSGYPGLAYLVFEDLSLEPYSNTMQRAQVKVEIVKAASGVIDRDVVGSILTGNTGDPTWGNAIFLLGIAPNSSGAYYITYERINYGDIPIKINFGRIEHPYSDTVTSLDLTGLGFYYARQFPTLHQFDEYKAVSIHTQFSGQPQVKFRFYTTTGSFESPNWITDARLEYAQLTECVIDRGEVFMAGANLTGHVVKISQFGILAGSQIKYSIKSFGASASYLFCLRYTGSDDATTTVYKFDRNTLALLDTYVQAAIGGRGSIRVVDDTIFYTCASRSGSGNHVYKWVNGVVVKDFGDVFPTVELPSPFVVVSEEPFYAFVQADKTTALRHITMVHENLPTGPAPLRGIVTDECAYAGLDATDLDLSTLVNDDVRGYRIATVAAVRSGLEPLQAAFPFDTLQSGYKVKFITRGGTSIATVLETELAASGAGDDINILLPVMREMDSQLPARVSVIHLNAAREYESDEQYAERLNVASVSERRVELAIVLTPQEAAQVADILLAKEWIERVTLGPFSLPPPFSYLEPGDIITINHRGAQYQARLTRVEYHADSRVTCSAVMTAAAAYSSTVPGAASGVTGQTLVPLRGKTGGALLDIPVVVPDQDKPGITAGLYGLASGWPGGAFFRSDDSGNSYQACFTSNQSAMGFTAIGVLGTGPTTLIDASSTLIVSGVTSGAALYSTTFGGMAAGANLAALGASGRWEIISFQTAVNNGDGTWTLSSFVRGRFGTEWVIGTHAAGDSLVMLDPTKLGFLSLPLTTLNSPRLYRAITQGDSIDSAVDKSVTYAGENLRPLASVYPAVTIDPVTSSVIVSWVPRTRTPVEPFAGIATPSGEAAEQYEADIYTAGFATLKRTVTGLTTPQLIYTYAQQVADFGSRQTSIAVKIYKVSATVGRGRAMAVEATVAAPSIPVIASFHFDGVNGATTIISEQGLTMANNGVISLSDSDPLFGSTSLLLTSGTPFIYGTVGNLPGGGYSEFCFDWWEKAASTTGAWKFYYGQSSSASSAYEFGYRRTSAGLHQTIHNGGIVNMGTTPIQVGAWVHMRVERFNAKYYVYENGVFTGTLGANNSDHALCSILRIGCGYNNTEPFIGGKIDDFAFYNMALARGANFAPPEAPFL